VSLHDEFDQDLRDDVASALGRKRALVIDDNWELVMLIRALLSQYGFDVYEAFDGAEGLERFNQVQPAIVILDVHLPQMNGWAVLSQLQQMSDVPVIMLTAVTDWMAKMKGHRLGAVAYVTKPFLPQDLVSRVLALVPG
jgi:DNA-binding response OmpR family regulator